MALFTTRLVSSTLLFLVIIRLCQVAILLLSDAVIFFTTELLVADFCFSIRSSDELGGFLD